MNRAAVLLHVPLKAVDKPIDVRKLPTDRSKEDLKRKAGFIQENKCIWLDPFNKIYYIDVLEAHVHTYSLQAVAVPKKAKKLNVSADVKVLLGVHRLDVIKVDADSGKIYVVSHDDCNLRKLRYTGSAIVHSQWHPYASSKAAECITASTRAYSVNGPRGRLTK